MLKITIRLLVALILIAYPVCVYFGLNYFSAAQLGLFFLILFVLRLILSRSSGRVSPKISVTVSVLGVALALFSWLYDSSKILLWYPVLINSGLFMLLAISLISPPSIIEQIARFKQDTLSEHEVAYTYKVTIVWSVFFFINACLAAWTVLIGNMHIWTIYNGLVAYVIMGMIFLVEWIVRQQVKQHSH